MTTTAERHTHNGEWCGKCVAHGADITLRFVADTKAAHDEYVTGSLHPDDPTEAPDDTHDPEEDAHA